VKIELEEQLVQKYPLLFRGRDLPKSENLMMFGCECGDGWYEIIDRACSLISGYFKGKDSDFKWFQIKEKYGTLRLYYNGGEGFGGYVDGVISMAESLSAVTCEQCGNAGSRRGGGWIVTLCDSCSEKRGKA